MLVVQGVVHGAAGLALFDEAQGAQDTQVLGDRRFRDAYDAGDIANAEFLVDEAVNDLHAV